VQHADVLIMAAMAFTASCPIRVPRFSLSLCTVGRSELARTPSISAFQSSSAFQRISHASSSISSNFACVVFGLAFGHKTWSYRKSLRKHHFKHAQRSLKTACNSSAGGVDQASINSLVDWLRMCGAYVSDAFTVVSSDPTVSVEGERGCVAGRDLNYGEMLLELPLECCLTYAPGAEDALQPISRELELAGIDPRDAALAVAFATEKIQGTDSPWWQYVSNVGAPPKTFPCFFDDKDLDALQSPALQELLVARDNAIKSIAHLYGLNWMFSGHHGI